MKPRCWCAVMVRTPTPWKTAAKAYTSKTMRVPSAEFNKRVNDPANQTARHQATLPGFIALAGALPIKVGDDVIGAVRVSGATGGERDEVAPKRESTKSPIN